MNYEKDIYNTRQGLITSSLFEKDKVASIARYEPTRETPSGRGSGRKSLSRSHGRSHRIPRWRSWPQAIRKARPEEKQRSQADVVNNYYVVSTFFQWMRCASISDSCKTMAFLERTASLRRFEMLAIAPWVHGCIGFSATCGQASLSQCTGVIFFLLFQAGGQGNVAFFRGVY